MCASPCTHVHVFVPVCPYACVRGYQEGWTHLAECLRLSHQDQHVGGQDGETEVHQDDGSLRANVPIVIERGRDQ